MAKKAKLKKSKKVSISICSILIAVLAILLIVYLGVKPVPVGKYTNSLTKVEYIQISPWGFVINDKENGNKFFYDMKKVSSSTDNGIKTIEYKITLKKAMTKKSKASYSSDGKIKSFKSNGDEIEQIADKAIFLVAQQITSLTYKVGKNSDGKNIDQIIYVVGIFNK